MYEWREFVDAGGLISYAPRRTDVMYQMGVYAVRILQGPKPLFRNEGLYSIGRPGKGRGAMVPCCPTRGDP
jgi:hypothetical protein